MAQGIKRDTKERSSDRELNCKVFAISKNDWIVLYVDLYRAVMGGGSVEESYRDALARLEILKANGLV